jgi:hypothetical protein
MPTNLDRAEWCARAQAALRCSQSATGADDDNALPDLLCDLQHWSDRENVNFEDALDTARMHHQAERDVFTAAAHAERAAVLLHAKQPQAALSDGEGDMAA